NSPTAHEESVSGLPRIPITAKGWRFRRPTTDLAPTRVAPELIPRVIPVPVAVLNPDFSLEPCVHENRVTNRQAHPDNPPNQPNFQPIIRSLGISHSKVVAQPASS